MVEVKVFRIEGEIEKPRYHTNFAKELRAVSEDDALEKLYSVVGGGEKVKRFQIRIREIKEIDPTEARDPLVRALSGL